MKQQTIPTLDLTARLVRGCRVRNSKKGKDTQYKSNNEMNYTHKDHCSHKDNVPYLHVILGMDPSQRKQSSRLLEEVGEKEK